MKKGYLFHQPLIFYGRWKRSDQVFFNKNSQYLVSGEETRSGIVAICEEFPYLANKEWHDLCI
jgi:hypothetical protein